MGLSPTGPRARKMRDLMVDQAAEGIRLLLLEHPDLHETVVEEVRRRRIPRMPWPVVNRGRATQLAVLFGYPPFLDPSSIVAAKRLTQLGRITDVVSQDISTLRKQDPGATRIASEYVDRSVMLPGVRRFDDWGSVRGYVEDALAQISEFEADSGPYESMYSRALAAHSHFAAALVKLRSPELHWVAEFSDPLLRNAHGGWREEQMEDDWLRRRLAGALKASGYDVPASNRTFEWAELIVYAWADEIIFTNRNQLDFMLGYCAHPALAATSGHRLPRHAPPGASGPPLRGVPGRLRAATVQGAHRLLRELLRQPRAGGPHRCPSWTLGGGPRAGRSCTSSPTSPRRSCSRRSSTASRT